MEQARTDHALIELEAAGVVMQPSQQPPARNPRLSLVARNALKPILGDEKYGARRRIAAADGGRRIALHSRSLRFRHPTRSEVIEIAAPVPADWPEPSQ